MSALYRKQALHQSHLYFIIACLDNNIIPRGLTTKKVPLVAKGVDFEWGLLAKWHKTLRKTSRLLLGHLKFHHRAQVLELTKEIKKEEVSLRRRRDFEERISLINQHRNQEVR